MITVPGSPTAPSYVQTITQVTATSLAPAIITSVTTVVASPPTPVTSPSPIPAIISSPATSMLYAPDVQRRFEKIVDLKMSTIDNIVEFWSQVDDPLHSEEMVLSKISIVAKKAIGLMLQNKRPNIGIQTL